MSRRSWPGAVTAFAGSIGLALGMVGVSVAAVAAHLKKARRKPIVIGAVIDETNTMKSFDEPAIETPGLRMTNLNARGRVLGRRIELAHHKLVVSPSTGTNEMGPSTGPTALQGIITAIERTHGDLSGEKLANQMVKFHKASTLSGPVSLSNKFHAVGRHPYRIIEVTDDEPHRVDTLSPGTYAGGA